MSGKKGLDKGKRAEREVVKLLQGIIDEVCEIRGIEAPRVERNLLQANKGGSDIHGLEWLALEVKHQESFNLSGWWKQTLEQATVGNRVPVLLYRKNHIKFRARLYGWMDGGKPNCGQWVVCDISLLDFLEWFRLKFNTELD